MLTSAKCLGAGMAWWHASSPCAQPQNSVTWENRVCRGPDHTKRAKARAIGCGQQHTAVLLANGTMYTAGSNQYGACGFGNESAAEDVPSAAEVHTQTPHHTLAPASELGCSGCCCEHAARGSSTARVLGRAHVLPQCTAAVGSYCSALPLQTRFL